MADRWDKTPPEGTRCFFTGASVAANGPYYISDRTPFVFSAVAFREFASAPGSPFVLATHAEMQRVQEALAGRMTELAQAKEEVARLKQAAARKPRTRKKSDGD